MKRKHFSILGGLLILMSGLPAYLCAVEVDDSSVSAEAEKRITAESRRDHVVQVMSTRLCSEYGKQQAESTGHKCISLIAEMAAEPAKFQEYMPPSLENVNWSGVDGFGEVTSELGYLQQTEAGANDLDGSILIAEKKVMGTDHEEIVATQEVDTAIPGSLLVTILALVGIVAVARRDVSGKQNPDPVVRSGAEVARISSLQDATKVDILHRRLN